MNEEDIKPNGSEFVAHDQTAELAEVGKAPDAMSATEINEALVALDAKMDAIRDGVATGDLKELDDQRRVLDHQLRESA